MPNNASIIVIGDTVLDLDRGTLSRNAQPIAVRPKSFALLKHLAANAGRVISKDELIEVVWGRAIVTDDALTQTIKDVRRAIDDKRGSLLRVHPKRGYSLTVSNNQSKDAARDDDGATTQSASENDSPVPIIVILPFHGVGAQAEWAYLAEGFASEITISLSRFRSLKVLASATARRLAPSGNFSSTIGSLVDFAVETTMTRSGDRLRFQLQMLDVRSGHARWAAAFSVEERELVGFEDEIAGRIAAALDREATEAVLKGGLARKQGTFEAFDCWLRGQHRLYHGDWTREGEQEAIDWFRKALLVDPTFARAHSSLALTLNVQPLVRPGLPLETEKDRALEHAKKALEYDDTDARSHLAMAWVTITERDRARAERHFALAANLNPNAADVLINCALGVAELGQLERAFELAERAIALNPTYPDIYNFFLSQIRLHAGDYGGAIKIGASISTMTPAFSAWLAAAAALAGDPDLARSLRERFLAITSSRWEGPEPFSASRAVDWFLAVTGQTSGPHWQELSRGLVSAGLFHCS